MSSTSLPRHVVKETIRHTRKAPNASHLRNWSLFSKSKPHTQSSEGCRKANQYGDLDGDLAEASIKALSEEELGRLAQPKARKTMAQMDEELRLAMEGRAGDGGESGVELEEGKAVAMKQGVRDNMFRYI